MPTRPLRHCSWPAGCPTLVANGRCAKHRPKRPMPAQRATTAQRGYGYRHQQAAAALLAQPDAACVDCGTTHDLCADHVMPGQPDYGYEIRCRPCNTRRGNEMRNR